VICEVSAYRSGRVFPQRITQSNRTRTCLYANFYQARGTTFKAIFSRGAEDVRYNERSAAERVNGRLKDDCGGRNVRVRGHAKVACHLMFGILALTRDQLLRLIN
jgi:Transposase DDE domain